MKMQKSLLLMNYINKNILAPQRIDWALGAPGIPTQILRVGPALARPNTLSSVVYNLSHYTVSFEPSLTLPSRLFTKVSTYPYLHPRIFILCSFPFSALIYLTRPCDDIPKSFCV